MLLSTRRRAIVVALLMFAGVISLRALTAEQWNYGPAEAEHFSEQIFGFDVAVDTPPFFLMWSRGDGQAFMSIAGDLDGQDHSRGLGLQSYRMSRIGLSIAARVLSIGQIEFLPYGLAAASIASYAGILAVGVTLWDRLGARGLLLGASPAAIIATVFDTSEGLGTLVLTLSMVSTSLAMAVVAALILGITRPSYGTASLASRHGYTVPALVLAAGAAVQLLLISGLGIAFTGSGGNIVLPLSGYLNALPNMQPEVIASAAVVLLMSSVLIAHGLRNRHTFGFRIAALASAGLAVSVSESTFVGPLSPLRVSGALVVLLVLEPLFRVVSPRTGTAHDSETDSSRERAAALGP